MNIICPACKSQEIKFIGKIPQKNTFAGKKLKISLMTSYLFKCKNCNLYFKWPIISESQSKKLYMDANPENWKYEIINRKDWMLANYWIKNNINEGSILDIGCWDGKFLESFNKKYGLFGIEINQSSIKKANKKGIKVIAKNINEIERLSYKFDAITAFDLIEHVKLPLKFIGSIVKKTKKNGYILISSGNTEAITWKISRSKYWYCSLQEHIVFTNLQWYEFVTNKFNLSIEYYKSFSHIGESSLRKKMLDFIKNIAYIVIPWIIPILRKIRDNYIQKDKFYYSNYNFPPSWISSKDHFLIILRKNGSSPN